MKDNLLATIPSGTFSGYAVNSLNLDCNFISTIENDAFHQCSLRALFLSSNGIRNIAPQAFRGANFLEHVDLLGNSISNNSIATLRTSMEQFGIECYFLPKDQPPLEVDPFFGVRSRATFSPLVNKLQDKAPPPNSLPQTAASLNQSASIVAASSILLPNKTLYIHKISRSNSTPPTNTRSGFAKNPLRQNLGPKSTSPTRALCSSRDLNHKGQTMSRS